MGTAGFVTALAASLLSLAISFIPVQFVNILMTLFLVFMTVMCRLLPERSSLKGCLVGNFIYLYRRSHVHQDKSVSHINVKVSGKSVVHVSAVVLDMTAIQQSLKGTDGGMAA